MRVAEEGCDGEQTRRGRSVVTVGHGDVLRLRVVVSQWWVLLAEMESELLLLSELM